MAPWRKAPLVSGSVYEKWMLNQVQHDRILLLNECHHVSLRVAGFLFISGDIIITSIRFPIIPIDIINRDGNNKESFSHPQGF